MEQWRKNVYLLWVAVFLAAACWTMVMPFMPVFLEKELGVSQNVSTWAGVLGAVNSLGMALMAPVWGAVGDRLGRKLMMMRAGIVLTIAYAGMAFVTGPYELLGVRILIGCFTGFIPTATALVGTTTPQEHVGRALAMVATAAPTGSILGPLVGGLIADLFGIRGAMMTGSVLVGIATLLVFVMVKEQFTPPVKERTNFFADMAEALNHRTFAALAVIAMIGSAAQMAVEPIMVPYIKGLLGDTAPNWVAGALYSLPGVAFIFAVPWWTARAERWGYSTTLYLGLGIGAVFVLLQALAFSAVDFGALRLAQGVAVASVNPGVASLIAMTVPNALRGRAFGINQSAFSVGAMIGPLVGGLIGDLAGPRWTFVASGLLLVTAAIWAYRVVAPRVAQDAARVRAEAPAGT